VSEPRERGAPAVEAPSQRYARYRELVRSEPLPLALIDLDAVDRNLATLLAPVRAQNKTLRLASKSLRSVELLRYLQRRGGSAVRGIMAYSPSEARFLAEQGFTDILVAYPTAQRFGAAEVAEANRKGAEVSLSVEEDAHLAVASAAALAASVTIPVVVDIDVSFRPFAGRAHLGVRRSPLRSPVEIADFVERIQKTPGLRFAGLLAYEAHIAGIADPSPLTGLLHGPKRVIKELSRAPALALRRAILSELSRRGIHVPLFNGGGSGSVDWSAADPSLTEVAAGSGFLDSHLFDAYRGLPLEPAAYFALQVTRRPAPGFVTCQGGGFVASGPAGEDRLPLPALPPGLRLSELEGAGEVQTPLLVPEGMQFELGDPVFFRHAKAGELAEHFQRYLLVRGTHMEGRIDTYRGAGQCFL
jgi:D-serine deaminase-like pyridoxal phosphate-dependent protein